jgi:hypothetical protein
MFEKIRNHIYKKIIWKEKLEKVISLKFNEGCKWNFKVSYQRKISEENAYK